MRERIRDGLRPVVRRQRAALLLQGATLGLLAGSAAAVVLGVGQWAAGRTVPLWVAATALGTGPVLGLIAPWIGRREWRRAAAAVDAHYGLKDRTVTALNFVTRHEADATDMHRLQVADAQGHLDAIEPRAVAPIRVPRALPYAAAVLGLAGLLMLLPLANQPVQAGPAAAPEVVVEQAEKIQERLKDLQELAKKEDQPELEELVKQLEKKAEEMKQPGVDTKEALAKLSEMQAAIAAQQAQFNLGMVDGQLQSLGDALAPADATEAAGQALQEGKFDQAAKELEKLEAPPVDRKDAKAIEEKLKQVAKKMGEAGLGQMSDEATEMAEGAEGGDAGKFGKGAKGLAKLTKGHGQRKKISQILDQELARLSECKGECKGDKAVRARIKTKKDSPSLSVGATISGNIDGDKSSLASKRDLKETTGQQGDGPSEMETTHSPEGKQQAARSYQESYQKYRKMSEAVLDSEPIPLGQRQVIRKYFELIRPQAGDPSSADKAPAAGAK